MGTAKGYGGTLIESGQYIAGAHLRGALGAIKKYLSPAEQQEIDQLLGTRDQNGINFPNCYPNEAVPLPLTAQSCKRASGFKPDKKEKEENEPHHGVVDTLLMQLAYDHVAGDGQWRIPLPFQYVCPECGNRTEPYGRMAEHLYSKKYKVPEVSSHRQTRVAINRARLTAEEGQLYSVQAIDEGSRFVGIIRVDDTCAPLARKWIEEIVRIGGRTSRGFGSVTVKLKELKPDHGVRQRIESFNDQYQVFEAELCTIAHPPPAPIDRTLFTINLRSDALLRDSDGVPTLRLDETMLRDALAEPDEGGKRQAIDSLDLKLIAQYTQPQQVSGWQTAWKLPKEVLLASRMGGLYVFAASTGGDPNRQGELIALLEGLEAAGIGEMRQDGYGQIVICDSFHTEVEPI
jgi:CRISPR-associated protein Csx10